MFFATVFLSYGRVSTQEQACFPARRTSATVVTIGAVNSEMGGGDCQFLLAAVKSVAVRWPRTDVMVTSQLPYGWPKSKLKE